MIEKVKIVYEDEHIIGIDKPSGLLVHPDGSSGEETLLDWVLEKYPEVKNVGESQVLKDGSVLARSGIVHRLDRDTSGVMLIALTDQGFVSLKEQFKKRSIQKTYRAFVYGNIKEEDGEIDRAIGRSSKDFRQWSAQCGARGKMREAFTAYRVLERGEDTDTNERITYVEASPKTGRTHQIRVHMKAINHPILCDSLYAPNRPCLLGFNRLALHAHKIDFRNIDSELVKAHASVPTDFQEAEKLLIQ